MKWEIIEQSLCYQGFFRIDKLVLRHSLFGGGESPVLIRELIRHSHAGAAAAVLPYDLGRDRVVLVEQFRTGAMDSPQGPWLVEIVAGLVDEGEEPRDTVCREALEEAGCTLQALHPIYQYYSSPGGFREHVSLYIARVDSADLGGIHGVAEEGEDIRIHVLDRERAYRMISEGLITSAQPIIALQWLELNRGRLMDLWG
jgi:ADP-ribose pyrophosphatase